MQRKGLLPGKIFTWCILQRRFAGLFGCMARISCQSQLILNTRRANLATKPPLPVRGHFRDAWSAKLATDCRPRTHRGEILPRQSARERIAREPCHRRTPGERISRAFCHRRVSGNASGHNLAIARRPINTSMKNLHNRHLTIVYKSLTRNQAEYNKEIGF